MSDSNFHKLAYSRYEASSVIDYNKFAKSYGRLVSPRLKIHKEWQCLDVACGMGNFLAYLRSIDVNNFLGVDITESVVNRVKNEFGQDKAIHCNVLEYLSAQYSRFNFISALDFVEHITKDQLLEFFEKSSNSLMENGFLLVRTPNPSAPYGMAARYNDLTHETCFTTSSFVDIASRFGFTYVNSWDDIGYPKTPMQLLHYVSWKIIDGIYKVFDSIECGQLKMQPMTRNYWVLLRKN